MDYHVFKKMRVTAKGKKKKFWYYYYFDNFGKQFQRVCKGCVTRAEAESFVRNLPSLSNQNKTKIKDIAATMFLRGSKHFERRIQLGRSVDEKTMSSNRAYVLKIIDRWGDFDISSINPKNVLEYLFTIDRSGSWKNCYLTAFKEIYEESLWFGVKVNKPAFPSFSRNSKKADIFTTKELKLIFQKENFPNDKMFLFFLLCFTAGMRLGEVRAVRAKQFIFDKKILIIDGFCKQDGTRTVYNKKGSVEKPKLRKVLLPDFVLTLLSLWISSQNLSGDDFCFIQNGKPVRSEYAEAVFYKMLQKTGFVPTGKGKKHLPSADGRKLVPHSLRYTYVSRMLRVMSPEDLKSYTGYADVGMTDYYNRFSLELELEKMPSTGIKAVMSHKGLLQNRLRLPLISASEELNSKLQELLLKNRK